MPFNSFFSSAELTFEDAQAMHEQGYAVSCTAEGVVHIHLDEGDDDDAAHAA